MFAEQCTTKTSARQTWSDLLEGVLTSSSFVHFSIQQPQNPSEESVSVILRLGLGPRPWSNISVTRMKATSLSVVYIIVCQLNPTLLRIHYCITSATVDLPGQVGQGWNQIEEPMDQRKPSIIMCSRMSFSLARQLIVWRLGALRPRFEAFSGCHWNGHVWQVWWEEFQHNSRNEGFLLNFRLLQTHKILIRKSRKLGFGQQLPP